MIAVANFARTMARRIVGDVQGLTIDEIELDESSDERVVAVSFWLPPPTPKGGVAVISPAPLRREARILRIGGQTPARLFSMKACRAGREPASSCSIRTCSLSLRPAESDGRLIITGTDLEVELVATTSANVPAASDITVRGIRAVWCRDTQPRANVVGE
jgi:hypothetical protein